jgi:hypothetical protein
MSGGLDLISCGELSRSKLLQRSREFGEVLDVLKYPESLFQTGDRLRQSS